MCYPIGMDTTRKLLTTHEAAEYLGLHVGTVQRLIKSGEIEAEQVNPRFYLISLSVLKAYKPNKPGRPKKT